MLVIKCLKHEVHLKNLTVHFLPHRKHKAHPLRIFKTFLLFRATNVIYSQNHILYISTLRQQDAEF